METLSYGYYKPENGDKGSSWFPRMADNMDRLNSHSHNGTDSATLSVTSITKKTSVISAGSWALVANGTYSQTITVPAGIAEINSYLIKFYNTSTGYQYHLTWERVTATTYTLYINDNSIAITAVYV